MEGLSLKAGRLTLNQPKLYSLIFNPAGTGGVPGGATAEQILNFNQPGVIMGVVGAVFDPSTGDAVDRTAASLRVNRQDGDGLQTDFQLISNCCGTGERPFNLMYTLMGGFPVTKNDSLTVLVRNNTASFPLGIEIVFYLFAQAWNPPGST